MTIGADGDGEIAYGAMQASLEPEYSHSMVFFTWAGFDEVNESPVPVRRAQRRRHHRDRVAYHLGDEAILKAERMASSTAC